MDFFSNDLNDTDLHIHTVASDGEMSASEIIEAAGQMGMNTISITDHDGVGAYFGIADKLKREASEAGVELVTGIELDSEYNGIEIHILGYGIDIYNKILTSHLEEVQMLRKKRIGEIVDKVNSHFNYEVLSPEEIFPEFRKTLMKPHVIRELVGKDLFPNYGAASRWVSENCRAMTKVPKLSPEIIIPIILNAGGIPVLAHPLYYLGKNGINIDGIMGELSSYGLAGVEVYYEYSGFKPLGIPEGDGTDVLSLLLSRTDKFGLFVTRGSDSHTMSEFLSRNPWRMER